jgi:hypothetical protein
VKLIRQLFAALLTFLAAFACTNGVAQSPPERIWLPPRLVVNAPNDAPVQVRSVAISGDVRGRYAWTEIDMTFYNPNRRVLEGELQFPLLDGQRIAGFAMDVNGTLRDAVPVEKARGQAVFEEIVRGNIDPGLLETTQGNNFKLRVYPIPAQGTKRVVLRIAETLTERGGRSSYRLPLGFADRIGTLGVHLTVNGASEKPLATSRALEGLVFVPEGTGYRLQFDRQDFAAGQAPTLDIAIRTGNAPVIAVQTSDGHTYFTADIPLHDQAGPRRIPGKIGLIWDSSGSGAARDHNREFALLDAYFRRMGNGEVRLTRIRHTAEPVEVFRIVAGNWSALRTALEKTVYDGATNLGAFLPDSRVQEYLLFSDGITNFGDSPFAKPAVPLYAICAATRADSTFLRFASERSGGWFVDLAPGKIEDGIRALLTAGTRIEQVTGDGVSQVVMSSRLAVAGRVLIAGELTERSAILRVRTRDRNGRAQLVEYPLSADANTRSRDGFAATQWAQLRVAELEGEFDFNRAEIRRLGQRFKLVTRETSLIVLDRIEDYVRYEIAPPAELRAQYEQALGTVAVQRRNERKAHLENIVRMFEEKVRWWERDFPKDAPPMREAKIAMAGAVAAAPSVQPSQVRDVATSVLRERAERVAPAAAPAPMLAKTMTAQANAPVASIHLQKWQPDAPYAVRMNNAGADDVYRVYLDEKPGYASSTAFFLDAADVLFDKGLNELGIRVLTNLAEMDLENRHILRLLGYRLLQAKQPALAIPVFRKVVMLSPDEPQSFRDLGLALAANGQSQKAIDSLYEVVIRPWNNRFPEIELITLAELNAIVATATGPIDTSRIEPRLLRNLPLDLRAVMTWDADNTDIDLWVTDPNGEKAFYGHRLTYQGGRMSADFTGGYGPEEFSLKSAKPGKYKVEAQYYGDRRQNITGATSLSVRLSTHFGTPQQKDETVSLRLKDKRDMVFVGEFEIR